MLKALSHPIILWGAWLRVDTWYQSGNLAPQPELSRWRLHPEAELRVLRAELQTGAWQPSQWQQLPYPKKGSCLRHYVLPTVRDQVAFMAHMVLLGPLLDDLVENFAFGNRWYRPIAWDRRQSPAQWVHRPYPLLTNSIHPPYARSHGLFRRAAHWTVARMTGASVEHEDYGGPIQHPDDYHTESLPAWTRGDWWSTEEGTNGRACWAALDVELAYPSVPLDRLRMGLSEMLSQYDRNLEPLGTLWNGYPGSIVRALADHDTRQDIGMHLVDALEQVHVESETIPRDAWRPFHASPTLPPQKDQGLPTGLAISGMLLNVVLYRTDRSVMQHLCSQQGDQRGAIVRFADDMYVLSRSPSGVLALIEAVWRGLSDDDDARLAVPGSKSNLYLNFTKVRPAAMRVVIEQFLEEHAWERCEDCGHLLPSRESRTPKTLDDWWTAREADKDFHQIRDAVERSTIGRNEVGPFVTTLVARLSDIGRDTLAERFGEGAKGRLVQLHELARFDIDDEQVAADTRRTFAVNRLVRAWLFPDEDRARTALSDIRDSVAHVLHKTPWKFALWGTVVRAAARRPIGQNLQEGDDEAKSWLSNQLRRVGYTPNTVTPESWMHTWPEECANEVHGADPSWRALSLSFHRAAFWHALANVLQELWRHHDRVEHPHIGTSGPSPRSWAVRAVPEGLHGHVAKFLGALDRWVDVLYPQSLSGPDLIAWSWELDQFVGAVLASGRRFDVADAWRHCDRPGEILMIPATLPWLQAPRTAAILERCGRRRPWHGRARFLDYSALAHVQLGGQDHRLGKLLFPLARSPRILNNRRDPRHAVAIGMSLGCSGDISPDLISRLVPEPEENVRILQKDTLALLEYSRARRILLGHEGEA